MPKLGALIKGLLEKAGVNITADDLKEAIASDLEIPQDAATKLETGLLTIEAAKSNSEVIKKVKAEIFNGADTKIAATLAELELEEDDDFKGEKNTFEKISKLAKLAKAAGEKKAGATGSKDKNEWATAEKEYNRQIKELKDAAVTTKTEFDKTRENDLTTFELKTILSGKDYIFPKEMDAALKINTALGAIQGELTKKELSIKRNAAGQLTIVNKDGNPAFSDTNVALEPNTFFDGVLAQNKLLKINQEAGAGGAGEGTTIIPGGGGLKGNPAVANEIKAQLQELG